MSWRVITLLALVPVLAPRVQGSKIIMAGPPAVSHCRELAAIGGELVRRGHVVKAYYPNYFQWKNCYGGSGVQVIEYQVPDPLAHHIQDGLEYTSRQIFLGNQGIGVLFTMLPLMNRICDAFLQSNMSVLQTEGFDLAIIDAIFMNRCLLVLPAFLGIPLVAEGSFIDPFDASAPFQGPRYPHILSSASRVSGLLSRLANSAFHIVYRVLIEFYNNNIDASSIHPNLTNFSPNQVMRDALLYVENSDHVLDEPKACFPNFVQAPALTGAPPRPLPDPLQRLLSEAPHGVVVAGFGSTLGSIPPYILDKMISALQQLNQTVLMKQTNASYTDGNVVFMQWLPMNDILGHQNVKVFVSHCGKNSFYESLFHAVPILCLPVNADGYGIASKVESYGIGLQLDIRSASTDDFLRVLRKIIEDPVYAENMKKASTMLRSSRRSGREIAADAIEHVLAFGGKHLRSTAAREENFFQHLGLDVWVAAILLLRIVVGLCLKCGRFFTCFRFTSKSTHHKQE